MNLKSLLVALVATTVGFTVYADTNTSGETKTKVEGQNSVEGNLDNEITNAKMRAESGSKSKYSASFSVRYDGGSLKDPGADARLNLLGGDNQEQVNLSATIKGRYRINKNTSVSANIGTKVVQPFHGNRGDQDKYLDKVEVANPSVTLSTYRRTGNWMLNYSANLTYFTSEQSTDIGRLMKPSVDATALYDFKNGFQVGIVGDIGYNIIDGRTIIGPNGRIDVPDLTLAVYPFAEYTINDTFNLRTVYNAGLSHSRYSKRGGHWSNDLTRQSFGLGISVTRDVFLYPNVQISVRDFYADASFKRSTVGLNATINAF